MRLFVTFAGRGGTGAWLEKTIVPSNLTKMVRARMEKTGESHQQALRHVRAQVAGVGNATNEGMEGPTAETMIQTASTEWYPLGCDGVWLEETLWERNLRMLRSRNVGRGALAALREVFTPKWSRVQTNVENVHPVVREAITIGGRYRLLEVGAMLAHMSEKKKLRGRLLPAKEYDGTCSELRGGLLLRAAGAEVDWEPVKNGSGPDWRASWQAGVLGVEVKRPRTSQRAEDLNRVEMAFHFEFMRALSDPPLRVDSGIWLTLHPSVEILAPKNVLGFPDIEAVKLLARDAADHVRRNMPSPTSEGMFSAGRAGDFAVHLGAGEQPQVQFEMYGLPGDDERHAKDLFDIIQEAAGQLGALKDTPGLVLLDADGAIGIVNQRANIYDTLRTEPWAKDLAGVVLVTRTSTSVEEVGESRIDTIVHVVPGPRVSTLENTLLSCLRVCDREHFHSDPLLESSPQCKLTW